MSNHLGDTNKMVSETPISDSTPHNVADLGMQIRRLERKLNAANVEIEEKRKDVVYLATEKAKLENYVMRLEAVTNDPHALWTNWLRGDVKLPVGIGDVRQYQERIKRLEELGNELRECARQLGWTSSDDSRWIERAESAVKAWDKEAKL